MTSKVQHFRRLHFLKKIWNAKFMKYETKTKTVKVKVMTNTDLAKYYIIIKYTVSTLCDKHSHTGTGQGGQAKN